jgi:hypothetical protein
MPTFAEHGCGDIAAEASVEANDYNIEKGRERKQRIRKLSAVSRPIVLHEAHERGATQPAQPCHCTLR